MASLTQRRELKPLGTSSRSLTPKRAPEVKKKRPSIATANDELVMGEEPEAVVEKTPVRRKKKRPVTISEVDEERKELDAAEQMILDKLPTASQTEQDYLSDYLRMLRRLRKLITKCYGLCIDNGLAKDFYVLSTLMSQQREVIADIRSVTDATQQVDAICLLAIDPLSTKLSQIMLDMFYQMRRLIQETAKDSEIQVGLEMLQKITNDVSVGLDNSIEAAHERVSSVLIGGEGSASDKKRNTRKKNTRR